MNTDKTSNGVKPIGTETKEVPKCPKGTHW